MNGFVVKRGREVGEPTPINAALMEMVREIEAGERDIHPDNLEELTSAVLAGRKARPGTITPCLAEGSRQDNSTAAYPYWLPPVF